MKNPIAIFSCLFVLAAFCFGQQPTTTTVIHAGHMLDVKTGRMLDNVTITIQGDKITRVGSNAGAMQAGANSIELPNATLLPGLIDAHTHITYEPSFGYQELSISVPKEALIGAKNARITLLGWSDRIGSVEEGKFADIIAVDGDPTKDVTLLQNPVFVMKGGVIYKQPR